MSSVSAAGYGGYNPVAIFQQNLFNKIDGNGDGSISKSELEQAVTTAGAPRKAPTRFMRSSTLITPAT